MIEDLRLKELLAGGTVRVESGWKMKVNPELGMIEFSRQDNELIGFEGNTVKSRQLFVGYVAKSHPGYEILPNLIAAVCGLKIVDETVESVGGVRVTEYTFGARE